MSSSTLSRPRVGKRKGDETAVAKMDVHMADLSSYAHPFQQVAYGFPQNGFLTADQVQQMQAMGLGQVQGDPSGQPILLDGGLAPPLPASDTADSEDSFDEESPLFEDTDGAHAGAEGNANSTEGAPQTGGGVSLRGNDGAGK